MRSLFAVTQVQLAEQLRKSIETISNFERGKVLPGMTTINDLCSKFGITLEVFFSSIEESLDISPKQRKIKMIEGLLMRLEDKDLDYVLKQVKLLQEYKD